MTKTPENHGKAWTKQEEAKLERLIDQNTPTRVIALKLERTPTAVQQHANELDLSTKPTNQSPYGTRGKSK